MMESETAYPQCDSTLDSVAVLRGFSPHSAREVRAMLGAHPVFRTMTDPQAVEAITLEPEAMPFFLGDISALREEAQHERHLVVDTYCRLCAGS